jgi:pSer/pThr/pTyr-binding forkhead associated (FHA) protein
MNARLLVVQGRPQGKSLLFPPGEYVFGRGAECHIRPNSDWVSRQHCLLRVVADGPALIRDLGSRNGTLVNGSRVQGETALNDGDHLQVGPLVFEVTLEESSSVRRLRPNTDHEINATGDTTPQLPSLTETTDPEAPVVSEPPIAAEPPSHPEVVLPRRP